MVIPSLITLLNDDRHSIRSATVFALVQLADHGEFVLGVIQMSLMLV